PFERAGGLVGESAAGASHQLVDERVAPELLDAVAPGGVMLVALHAAEGTHGRAQEREIPRAIVSVPPETRGQSRGRDEIRDHLMMVVLMVRGADRPGSAHVRELGRHTGGVL